MHADPARPGVTLRALHVRNAVSVAWPALIQTETPFQCE